jgi:hypothetical protein
MLLLHLMVMMLLHLMLKIIVMIVMVMMLLHLMQDYCDDSDGDDFMCMVMPKEWGVSGISALPRWS